MKSIKEKQLLVKWSQAMNEPIDAAIVEEVERYERIKQDILISVKQNTLNDLKEASLVANEAVGKVRDYPKPPTVDELMQVLKEEQYELVQTQTTKEPSVKEENITDRSIIERASEYLTREVKLEERNDSFQQPEPDTVSRNVNEIRSKLKYLEQWLGKISAHGPGGGAGDIINLDHPVKLVTGNYTLTRKDYYVGVNAATTVNIIIPDSIGYPGRRIIIKDESGRCSKFPIIVAGNVDNDPGGFILKINNGAIQMIYREGWRIV